MWLLPSRARPPVCPGRAGPPGNFMQDGTSAFRPIRLARRRLPLGGRLETRVRRRGHLGLEQWPGPGPNRCAPCAPTRHVGHDPRVARSGCARRPQGSPIDDIPGRPGRNQRQPHLDQDRGGSAAAPAGHHLHLHCDRDDNVASLKPRPAPPHSDESCRRMTLSQAARRGSRTGGPPMAAKIALSPPAACQAWPGAATKVFRHPAFWQPPAPSGPKAPQ